MWGPPSRLLRPPGRLGIMGWNRRDGVRGLAVADCEITLQPRTPGPLVPLRCLAVLDFEVASSGQEGIVTELFTGEFFMCAFVGTLDRERELQRPLLCFCLAVRTSQATRAGEGGSLPPVSDDDCRSLPCVPGPTHARGGRVSETTSDNHLSSLCVRPRIATSARTHWPYNCPAVAG